MRSPNIATAIVNYCNAPDFHRKKFPLSERVGLDPSSREGQLTDLLGNLLVRPDFDPRILRGRVYNILKNQRYSQGRAKI